MEQSKRFPGVLNGQDVEFVFRSGSRNHPAGWWAFPVDGDLPISVSPDMARRGAVDSSDFAIEERSQLAGEIAKLQTLAGQLNTEIANENLMLEIYNTVHSINIIYDSLKRVAAENPTPTPPIPTGTPRGEFRLNGEREQVDVEVEGEVE